MEFDLSILIPSRSEQWLNRTISDIFEHSEAATEVIAVLDGEMPKELPPQHERLTVVYLPKSIGQRAATNLAAKLSKAKYLAKTDAHISVSQGFDRILLADMKDDWTVAPTMKNLHAFDWVCKNGHRRYQGPSGKCIECGAPTTMDVLWKAKDSPNSRSYCFDSEPHFQYSNDYTKRKEFKEGINGDKDLTYSMSLQGSFFMMTRKKYWELNAGDETFGSWGSQGLQIAASTWLTGGKVVINNKCFYAHLFRTQGGDFTFPYPQDHKKVLKTRAYAKEYFFNNKMRKQIYPISWLLEKFWPIRGWTNNDYITQKNNELQSTRSGICSIEYMDTGEIKVFSAENIKEESLVHEQWLATAGVDLSNARWHIELFCRKESLPKFHDKYLKLAANGKLRHPPIMWEVPVTKGILYYTDGTLDPKMEKAVQDQLLLANIPITAVSLKPITFGSRNIQVDGERSALTMARQILAGLEAMDTDIVYCCEHDCLYPISAFSYIPTNKDVYSYNINCWKLNVEKAYGLKVDDCRQLSGLCAYRETLLNHFRIRVQKLEAGVSARDIGFEAGTHNRKERIDDLKSETWSSAEPIVDIRRKNTFTKTKWRKEEFRNKKYTIGWQENSVIPYWGPSDKLIQTLI